MGNSEERFNIIIENPQRLQDEASNCFIKAVAHIMKYGMIYSLNSRYNRNKET